MGLGHRQATSTTPRWELTLGLVGAVLVLAGLVYLSWAALTEKQIPPHFELTLEEVTPVNGGYLVTIQVSNKGSTTVAGLTVEGQLTRRNGQGETSSTQIDYVPSHSDRSIGLFFSRDPREADLKLRAVGYQET